MSAPSRRRLSVPGLVVLLASIAMIAGEERLGLMQARVGPVGRTLIWVIGGCGALIGGQFVLAGLLPELIGRRGAGALVRNRFAIPREGWVAIGILITLFIGAMIGRNNTLLLVFALLAAPFILNGFATFTLLKRIDVARGLPARAEASRPVPVDVTLHNRRRWLPAWLMSVRDEVRGVGVGAVGHDQTELSPQVTFLKVGGRGEQTLTYRLLLPERGRYAFGPAQLNTRFPIGLVERGLVLPLEGELLVHPRIGRLSASWRSRLRRGTEMATTRTRQAGSFDDDFHRVREYQQGDDPRAIHWPTTARRGELIVREFRESRDRPLAVLVDLWRDDLPEPRGPARPDEPPEQSEPSEPSETFVDWLAGRGDRAWRRLTSGSKRLPDETAAPDIADARVELALDLAATLCVDHLKSSQQSHVYCAVAAGGGGQPSAWDSSTWADLTGLLDHLATVEPHRDDAGELAPALVARWSQRRRRGEQVVWITTRPGDQPPVGLPADAIVLPVDLDALADIVTFDV